MRIVKANCDGLGVIKCIHTEKKGHWIKELLYGVGGEMNEACKIVCTDVSMFSLFQCGNPPMESRTSLSQDTTLRKTLCLVSVKRDSQHFNDCPAVPYHL